MFCKKNFTYVAVFTAHMEEWDLTGSLSHRFTPAALSVTFTGIKGELRQPLKIDSGATAVEMLLYRQNISGIYSTLRTST